MNIVEFRFCILLKLWWWYTFYIPWSSNVG